MRTSLYRNLSNHANDAVYHCSFLQCFNLLLYIYRLFSEATVFFLQHIRRMLLHVSHQIYCFHNQSSGSIQVITCVFSFGMYFTYGKSDFFWLIKSTAIHGSLVILFLTSFPAAINQALSRAPDLLRSGQLALGPGEWRWKKKENVCHLVNSQHYQL